MFKNLLQLKQEEYLLIHFKVMNLNSVIVNNESFILNKFIASHYFNTTSLI